MLRKLCLLFMLLLVSIPTALAQPAQWQAFLFNSLTGQLLLLDAAGNQTRFELSIPQNAYVGGYALDASGTRFAYCVYVTSDANALGTAYLRVYDSNSQAHVLDADLGQGMGCTVSPRGISAGGDLAAVSVARAFAGDESQPQNTPLWQLFIYDVDSGQVVHELNSGSTLVRAAGLMPHMTLIPGVQSLSATQAIITEVPWAVGGAPEWQAFVWDLNANTLSADTTGQWGKSGLTTSPDEMIWVDLDASRAAATSDTPMPSLNVIMQAGASAAPQAIYHTADNLLMDTAYTYNGQQLGVLWMSPIDFSNTADQVSGWLSMTRDGVVTASGESAGYVDIAGTPDGFLLFLMEINEVDFSQSFTLDSISGENTARLWEDATSGWELVGVRPEAAPVGLPAFVPAP